MQSTVKNSRIRRQTLGGWKVSDSTGGKVAHGPVARLADRDGDHDADG